MSVTNLFLDGDVTILTAENNDANGIVKLFVNMGVSAAEAVNIVSSIDMKTNHATKLYPIDMGRYVKNADSNVCKRFSIYITDEVLHGVLRDPIVDYAKVSVVNVIDEKNNVDKYKKTNLDTLLGFSSESGVEHNVYWVDRNLVPVTDINNCSIATEYVNSLNGTTLTSDLEKCIDTLRWSGSNRVGDDANKQDTYCRKYFVNVDGKGNETISDTPTENEKYIHACEKLTYSADVSEVTGLDKVPFSNPRDQSYSLADEFTTPNYYCTDNWVIEEFMNALQLNEYDYYDISDSSGLSYSVSQTEKNGYGNPKIIINNNTNGKFINDINTLYGGIAKQKSMYDISNTYTGKDGAKASFNDSSQMADRWGHNNTIVYSDIKSSNSVSEAYKDGEIYKKKWQFVDENLRHDFYKDRESTHKLEYDDTEYLPNATYKFDYDKENGLGIYFPIKEVISEKQSYILPYESFDVIWAHRWNRHNTVDFMRGDYGEPIQEDGKNKYPWDGTRMVIDRNMPSAKSDGFKYKHAYNIIVKYTTGHYSSTDPCTNKNIESHGESYKDEDGNWQTRDNVFTNNSKGLENILKTYCTSCNYQHYEKNDDYDMKTKYNVDTLTSISKINGNIDKYARSNLLEGTSALSGIANYYCKDQSVKDKLDYCFTSNMPIGTHPTTSTSSVTVSAARVATNVDLDVIHDHYEDTPIYLTTYNSYNNTPVISKTDDYPNVYGTPSYRDEYVIEEVGSVTLSGTQYNILSGSIENTDANWRPSITQANDFFDAVRKRLLGATGTIWWNLSSVVTKESEPIKDADGNITGHTPTEYKHTYSYLGETAVTGHFSVTVSDTIYYIGDNTLAKNACSWNLRDPLSHNIGDGEIIYNLTEMTIPVTKYWKRLVGTAEGYFNADSTTCIGDPAGSIGTDYYVYSDSSPSQAVRDRLKICQGISSLSNISVSTLSEGYRYIITNASTRSFSFDYVKTDKTAPSYIEVSDSKMNMFTSIQYYDDLVYHLQSSGWNNMIDLATFNTTTDNIVYQVKTVSSLSCNGYYASGIKYEYAEDDNTELWQFDVSKADEIFGDNDNTYMKGEPKIQYGYLPKRVDDGTVNANYTPWTPSHIYKASFNEDNYTYDITDSTDLKDITIYHFHGRFTFYYKSYSYYYTYFSGSTLSIWNSRVRTMLHFWMQLHARKADVTYVNQYNEHTLSDYYNAGNAPDDKRDELDTPQVYIEYDHGVTTLYSSKTGKANDVKMNYGLRDNDDKEFPVMVSPFGKEKMGYTKSLGAFRLFTRADDHIHIASITNDGMQKDTNALVTQVNVSYTRPELTVNVGGKLGGLTIVLPKGYVRSRLVGPNEDIKNQFGVSEYEKDAEVTLEKGHYVRYIIKDANGNDRYEESYDENGNKVSTPVYGYNPIENLSDDNKLEVTETYHKKNNNSSNPAVSTTNKNNPDYEILPNDEEEQFYADTKKTLINDPMLYETVEVTISVNGTQVDNRILASEFTDRGNREYTAPSYANTVTIKYSLKDPVNPNVMPTTITIYNNRQGSEPDVSKYILKNRLLYFVGSILNN